MNQQFKNLEKKELGKLHLN